MELAALPSSVSALLIAALGGVCWWSFVRLFRGIERELKEIKAEFRTFQERHPTREEMEAKLQGVHHRVDDLRFAVNRRWTDPGHEE